MEQALVAVSAGLAMEGFRPIAHTITPFLVERALEQLKLDFGYQGLAATFVSVGASYDYAAEGPTHHSAGDVQVLSSIPGMQIFVPGAPSEVDLLIRRSFANDSPTYLRTSVSRNAEGLDVEPGRLEVLKRGSAGAVIAFGPMLDRTVRAVSDLDVTLLYATSVEPFDAQTLRSVADQKPAVITVEPFYEGSVTMRISEALRHVPSRIGSVGVPREFIARYGTVAEHDRYLRLDEEGVREQIVRFLE